MPLFKNKGALNLDRLTVEVVGRNEEAERLRNILKGTEQDYLPKVISVFGPPGSGKTLVTRRVCSDYEKESGGNFKFFYINLGEAKTVFSATNSILTAVGGTPKSSRVGLDGVMNDFWEKVRELGQAGMKFLLVELDEADRLFLDIRGDPSGLLYGLVRSENRLEGSGVSLSLLVISNMLVWDYWELDGRVKSSMGTEEIFFSPYSKEELKQILLNGSNEAFASGVVKEDVIDSLVITPQTRAGISRSQSGLNLAPKRLTC
jgi:cell division control protein 6